MSKDCGLDRLAIGWALLLWTAPWCFANTLNLPISPTGPTIQSNNGGLTFTSVGGHLTATMQPLAIAGNNVPGGLAFFDPGGETRVDLITNAAGQFVMNG